MATFLGLQEFIKKLAAAQPDILLDWMPRLNDRLANWLPSMLQGLSDAGHGAAVNPRIETWVGEDRHLSSITWYLQFAEAFRFDLVATITAKGLAAKDDQVLQNVAVAAARQSTKHPDGLFDAIFLPAVQSLSSRGLFGWVGGMFNWDQLGLLKGLSAEQVEPLLALIIDMPRLGTNGEALLAVIAHEHVQAVIDLIGQRFLRERETGDFRYEDLPHALNYLRAPLAAAPVEMPTLSKWRPRSPANLSYSAAFNGPPTTWLRQPRREARRYASQPINCFCNQNTAKPDARPIEMAAAGPEGCCVPRSSWGSSQSGITR
ncbi:hypothetical protein [Mesorhizobium sp. M0482]|uniref:hypothetical protein n=1 Tax=Mesorhizobium sp. M0482 TaxID=2956948 RepID=UPI00333681DD